jgi:hypothetical protein
MKEIPLPTGSYDASAVDERRLRGLNHEIGRAFKAATRESELWSERNKPNYLDNKRLDIYLNPDKEASLHNVEGLEYLVDQEMLRYNDALQATMDLDEQRDAICASRAFFWGATVAHRILGESYEFPPYEGDYQDALHYVYRDWRASADFEVRRQTIQSFLEGQQAGALAHELLDMEDPHTIVGCFAEERAIPWSDVVYGDSDDVECMPIADGSLHTPFIEGVMCTLFAVSEHQIQNQMASTVYRAELPQPTAVDHTRAAVNEVTSRYYYGV